MTKGEQLVLEHIETSLECIERAPAAWGDMRAVEGIALMFIETRQLLLRPNALTVNPYETRNAFFRWISAVNGEETNWTLTDVLKEGGMLEQLPKLMCDFGRWVALKYPAESEDDNEQRRTK